MSKSKPPKPRSTNSRSPSFARGAAAVYAALLHALDTVLEEGVPRGCLVAAGLSVAQADEWQRAFVQAESLVTELHAHPLGRSVARRTRLVVIAASLGALARHAGLDDPANPGLAQLRTALDAAYDYARAAHDERLQRALSGSAA